MFKTRRQWTSSIGHEVEDKDVQNKRCCIRTEDDRGTSLPQGPKLKKGRKKRCSALTIDGSRGSKGGGGGGCQGRQ